jgi:hypothetical protein
VIERLNSATNLIGMFLVLAGAALAFKRPDIGASIITGAFGLLAGKHIADGAKQQ